MLAGFPGQTLYRAGQVQNVSEPLSLKVNIRSIFPLCWKIYISRLLDSISITALPFLRAIGTSFPFAVTPTEV